LPIVFFIEAAAAAGRHGPGIRRQSTHAGVSPFGWSWLIPLVGITGCFCGNAVLLGCCDVVIRWPTEHRHGRPR
jgi:hypothetical protein